MMVSPTGQVAKMLHGPTHNKTAATMETPVKIFCFKLKTSFLFSFSFSILDKLMRKQNVNPS